jgi:hypothetical protein
MRAGTAVQAVVAPRDVYYGGDAWTGKHDVWLRTMRYRN